VELVGVVLLVALGLLLLAVLWGVVTYNGFVRLRNLVQEAWRQIDVELHRRHDLIPNLVETVKGYAAHERAVFDEVTAARAAAEAGIPVSTISFGTDYGTIEINPGERTPVAVDNASMRQIADLSGGQFFTATSEGELRQVYAELGDQIGYEVRRVDVSRPWLAGGALLLVVGLGAGIALGRRLP